MADEEDERGLKADWTQGLIVATGRTQSATLPMTQGGATIFNSAPYLQEGVSGDTPYLVKINPSVNGTASPALTSCETGGEGMQSEWRGRGRILNKIFQFPYRRRLAAANPSTPSPIASSGRVAGMGTTVLVITSKDGRLPSAA